MTEWRPARKDGPLHLMERVYEAGAWKWKPRCGLWGTDGYEKVGRGELKCRTCQR